MQTRNVPIGVGTIRLWGDLAIPEKAEGIVLFAHGSGSSRKSSRNRQVAELLHEAGLATLLFDLLTEEEGTIDDTTRELRFDINLLSKRLIGATRWARVHDELVGLKLGYFGASTGAAAALIAAAELGAQINAVVSRGGRPDLAGDALAAVRAPSLLIVGGEDREVLGLNEQALAKLGAAEKKLELVPGATHLFEEPGALDQAASLACDWFTSHL